MALHERVVVVHGAEPLLRHGLLQGCHDRRSPGHFVIEAFVRGLDIHIHAGPVDVALCTPWHSQAVELPVVHVDVQSCIQFSLKLARLSPRIVGQ
eukprot:5664894-Alexandrium_andersonii.AAC.1